MTACCCAGAAGVYVYLEEIYGPKVAYLYGWMLTFIFGPAAIGGYVQIPCIERNAVGAIHAYNAYLLASAGDPARQKIDFDAVVEAMLETGRDMSERYKETARAGLAVCSIRC